MAGESPVVATSKKTWVFWGGSAKKEMPRIIWVWTINRPTAVGSKGERGLTRESGKSGTGGLISGLLHQTNPPINITGVGVGGCTD